MNILERKNTDLIKEFNRYVREHPEFAGKIPNNAIVVMQLEGDDEFNKWSLKLGRKHVEKGQPVVCVRIKRIKPISSRIEELEVEQQIAQCGLGVRKTLLYCIFINGNNCLVS